jgi:DNA-binding beta-propeller fold protein YncE
VEPSRPWPATVRRVLGDAAAATSAELDLPSGVVVDSSGNFYIADTNNCVIRKVAGGTITTYVGSNQLLGQLRWAPGTMPWPSTPSSITPTGLALDAAGNLYIADTGNNRIRIVNAATGIITSLSTGSYILNSPKGVAVDAAGNVYIADTNNSRILKVAPSGSITITTTFAGLDNGAWGYSGDGGPATSAQLNYPYGVAWMPPATSSSRIPITNGFAGCRRRLA